MPELPPESKSLLLCHFDSVESMEIAALLERSSTAYWTPQAISQQLGIPLTVIDAKLVSLLDARLLVRGEQTGAYRFAPATEELGERMRELLRFYSEQRAVIINTIYSANLERLRAFSNAFRLKKDS